MTDWKAGGESPSNLARSLMTDVGDCGSGAVPSEMQLERHVPTIASETQSRENDGRLEDSGSNCF